jgi:superfamily I DNA/RNA helicase/RecB family exonuclease
MELTEGQRRIVDHGDGVLRVVGGAGTGSTTALTARYLRLVGEHRPSSVLVLCRNRAAAIRFRDSVLPRLAGGFDSLPVTTLLGLAFDVVTRHDGPRRLVAGPERGRIVARLLSEQDPAAWPTLGPLLGRPAMVAEVTDALLLLQQRPAEAGGCADPAWAELERFLPHYRRALDAAGGMDAAGLVARAAQLVPDAGAGAGSGGAGRFEHVLVDDVDPGGPAGHRLLRALAASARDLVVTGQIDGTHDEPGGGVDLGQRSFRRPAPPLLVTCRHPSLEVEAVAAELLAARDRGVAWADMAVLVRRPTERAGRISRALARHGVPAAAPARAAAPDDPVVGAVVDMLRWVDGDDAALDRLLVSPLSRLDPLEARRIRRRARDEGTTPAADARLAPLVQLRDGLAARAAAGASPSELAFEVWRQGLSHLVDGGDGDTPGHSLDALVGFLDALERDGARQPAAAGLADLLAALDLAGPDVDTYRVAAAAPTDAVTVSSIQAAAGREWHTVVLAGCVEGEIPWIRARHPVFDPATLDGGAVGGAGAAGGGGDGPPSAAERRRQALAEERRLFALAGSRATGRLVGVAAPEPGVLLSRFVEAWTPVEAGAVVPAAEAPVALSPTRSHVPVVGDAGLTLSATQLDTYDDCPLRYAYRYVVRVRDEGGVRADLGSLVHDVLRRFLDPAADEPVPRTRDALLDLARRLWRDDIARYRPQVEEARRDYFAMLERWWDAEGEGPLAPEVLAVERPFDIEVAGHRLRGAIDRIDRADDGVGIRILDYKTGKSEPTPARAQAGDNLQLAVYHLAATRDPDLAVLGPPTQLRLLFLRSMHCYDQDVAPGMAEATEARVADVAARIRREEFLPAVDANCRWCSFHRLCPIQPEGREVGG